MIEWQAIGDAELVEELRGAANGPRDSGEVSTCGRYLIARSPSTHPARFDSWELYGRSGEQWRVWTCWVSRQHARDQAERIARERAGGTAA